MTTNRWPGRKGFAWLAVVALASPVIGQQGGDSAAGGGETPAPRAARPAPSQTSRVTASAVIRIEGASEITYATLSAIVNSVAVHGEVTRALEMSNEIRATDIDLSLEPLRQDVQPPRSRRAGELERQSPVDVLIFTLHASDITGNASPAVLRKLLDHAVLRLRDATVQLARRRDQDRAKELAAAKNRIGDVRNACMELRTRREQLFEQSAGRGPEELKSTMRQLLMSLDKLRVDIETQRAREAFVTRQIAESAERAKAELAANPVIPLLKELVAAAKANLEHKQKLVEGGFAPPEEVTAALEKLAEAEIRLAEESRSGGAAAGNLTRLNMELSSLAMQRTQDEAKLAALEEQLSEIRQQGLLEKAYAWDFDEPRIRQLEGELQALETRIAELEQLLLSSSSPNVEVVGLEASDTKQGEENSSTP